MATGDTCRNDVRHEQQAQALRREVRGDGRPEPVHIGVAIRSQHGRELGFRIAASRFGVALERAAQLLRRPGLRGVRRVLQELSDGGAANLGVRAALHLRQRGHRILVDDQVIDRPPGGLTRRRSDALLAGDEDPAARISGTDLLAVEQFRVLGNQRLELGLGGKRRLFERFELAVTGRRVGAFRHGAFLAWVPRRSDASGVTPYAGTGCGRSTGADPPRFHPGVSPCGPLPNRDSAPGPSEQAIARLDRRDGPSLRLGCPS